MDSAGDSARVRAHQTVVVQGDRIVALGPTGEVRVPRGARRIDGRGKFLVPGFGDMHTHLGFSGSAHAERHLLVLLATGVTTVRNMDFKPDTEDFQPFATSTRLTGPELLQLKARVAAGELLGPRIYTSAAWRTDPTKSVDANVAAYKAAGYDHLKWYWEDSATTDSLATATHRLGLPLVGHGTVGPGSGLARPLALGFTSIEHTIPYTTADSAKLRAEAAATVRAGMWNCIGPFPVFNRGLAPSPLERRYAAAELELMAGKAPDTSFVTVYTTDPKSPATSPAGNGGHLGDMEITTKALHAAGAKLLLGSDMSGGGWGFGYPPFAIHRGLEELVRLGFTPYEALTLVTRNVAEYFGTLDRTGTVAVGKRADLVLLGDNPLADVRHVSAVVGVMLGGRWFSQAELARRLDAVYARDRRALKAAHAAKAVKAGQ